MNKLLDSAPSFASVVQALCAVGALAISVVALKSTSDEINLALEQERSELQHLGDLALSAIGRASGYSLSAKDQLTELQSSIDKIDPAELVVISALTHRGKVKAITVGSVPMTFDEWHLFDDVTGESLTLGYFEGGAHGIAFKAKAGFFRSIQSFLQKEPWSQISPRIQAYVVAPF